MPGTYKRYGWESTPTRYIPRIIEHEGRRYVIFDGKYYTYDQWIEMEEDIYQPVIQQIHEDLITNQR